MPIFVESDVRVAALAEARLAPPGEHDLFYVSWGTGISSTLVVDGTCRAGRHGEALALGEFDVPATVDPHGPGTSRTRVGERGRSPPTRWRIPEVLSTVAPSPSSPQVATSTPRQSSSRPRARRRACGALVHRDPRSRRRRVRRRDRRGRRAARAHDVPRARRLLSRPDPPALRPARSGDRAGVIGAGLTGWQRLADDQSPGGRRGSGAMGSHATSPLTAAHG